MIVPMVKAYAVCRAEDADALLRRLREVGVLHIVPVRARAPETDGEDRDAAVRDADAAIHMLRAFEPRGPEPTLSPGKAVDTALAIGREGEEARARLDALYREADQLQLWGGVRVAQLRALGEADVVFDLLVVPDREVDNVRARVVHRLRSLPRNQSLVAAIDLDRESLPARAEILAPPERDRTEVLAEAASIQRDLDANRARLARLAWLVPELEEELLRREQAVQWDEVVEGGLAEGPLFAVQGWLPADRVDTLRAVLEPLKLAVALRIVEPEEDDEPPTLVRTRRWARPVEALFRILRMVPGYREQDASSVFMVALPLFAGMIIGDAGYGLLFILAAVVPSRVRELLERDLRIMMILFGCAAVAWGGITGVWFGMTPAGMIDAGGLAAALGSGLHAIQIVRGSERDTWMLLIKICFLIGAAHLILAHARRALAFFPDPRALAEAGWCVILASMLGVIWILFFGSAGGLPDGLARAAASGLAVGLALVAGFTAPHLTPFRRIGVGLAGSLLPLLGTFSDTLSYIRLMAVGLASYYLGSTFNVLAGQVADGGSWIAAALLLVAGHSLNIGLIIIAIFAHGVRLNVLEFSSNAGIRWTGHPYRPFSDRMAKEG
jgi:V/A-type H+-transporting ATPase subunit I